ncbi:MAG: nitrilase family protein [Muribaculaceae bacterium]|nr:nitrilase family protein [Muribaculaceae bacterium]
MTTACDSRTPMKVAAISLNSSPGLVTANLEAAERLIAALDRDTDLAVLPELFSTGFIHDGKQLSLLAENGTGTMADIMRWSRTYDMAIAGSFLAVEEGKILNRGFIVTPDGNATIYDKHHLFCLSPESKTFTAGTELPPTVHYRGWNIALVICYDLRFPVWCRNKGLRYDMLLVPANWPHARAYAWRQLLIARAIENQAVVVGANRSGQDDYGEYSGLSYIIDPYGGILAPNHKDSASHEACCSRENADVNGIIYSTYALEQIEKLRRRLPVASDADAFEFT